MMEHAALVKLVGVFAARGSLRDTVAFEFEDLRLDRAGDRVSDLVLQFEQIGEVTIISLGHDVMAGVCLDQLGGDANSTARFAHAAFEDVAYAQLLPDLFDVDGLALVGESRVAGDYWKGAPAGEHQNDVLGDAVGEKLLLGIAAKIGKRQHCDGPPVVETRRARRQPGAGGKEVF